MGKGPGKAEVESKHQHIIVERRGKVGLITLNRPQSANALCEAMIDELAVALADFEKDDEIGCLVLTGSNKVFCAGADIKAMMDMSHMHGYKDNFAHDWNCLAHFRKPVIAAVAGSALGGGCELTMMCDIVLAADNARFGLPEITIGTVPGLGGTQRMPRAIGKSKAMEMCLTARPLDAHEAERSGLVSHVLPVERLLDEALAMAEKIAGFSLPVVMMIKESVGRAFETSLHEGLLFERRTLHTTFALNDQKEGMAAFIEKRPPRFTHS